MNEIDYYQVLSDLEDKRANIDTAIKSIRKIFIESEPGEVQSDTFYGLTVIQATVKYLEMQKKKQVGRTIATALERGGVKYVSKNFYNTVNTVLAREAAKDNGRIVKVGRSEYSLPEWNLEIKWQKSKRTSGRQILKKKEEQKK